MTTLAAATAVTASLLITAVTPAAAQPATAASAAEARGGGGSGGGEVTPNDKLPDAIKVTAADGNLNVVATLRGVGKQVYDCQADGTWKLREPVATLSTLRGAPAGIHGAGPFWASFDGSRVVGVSPVPEGNQFKPAGPNVNWLKVTHKENFGAGGVFSTVQIIQRIDTSGGVAPPGKCTAGATVAVDYRTNYVFWSPK